MSEPFRAIYLFLPWYAPAVLYGTFFVCGMIMLLGLRRHLHGYGMTTRQYFALLSHDLLLKVGRFSRLALGQEKVVKGGAGGVMHGAVFYGWLLLFIYTSLVFIQSDILPVFGGGVFLKGPFYLLMEFLGDTFGLAFIVGLMIAVYRRYVQRTPRLRSRLDDGAVLGMLIWIGASGFVVEALRFASTSMDWGVYSPVGYSMALAIAPVSLSLTQLQLAYQGFWWAHMFSVMLLIAVTPWTGLVHVFTSTSNIVLAPEKPMGRLTTPFSLTEFLEKGTEPPPNARRAGDLHPARLLALDACTNCGRCEEVCPAYAAGRDLSPRNLIQELGEQAQADRGADVFAAGALREDELWSCTACNACVNACPVLINQVDFVVDFRRTLVAEGKVDASKRIFLENIGRADNPFGLPKNERQSWLAAAGVPTLKEHPSPEYLYWVGCQGSYDPRSRKITSAVVRILREAKVDFAVLGNAEACTGEPVRRIGEEARFQELALRNIEVISRSGAKKVLVHCPHCFNTFLNEYPELGAKFTVVHHSQLIAELISQGKLKAGQSEGIVTYHDPCNLGRMNGVFEDPREAIKATKGIELVEMPRSRQNSFCCGGGGGNVWYQVPERKKISEIRMEEAIKTGAATLAVGCPFCITMFEDAAKGLSSGMAVKDLAEIIVETLPPEQAPR